MTGPAERVRAPEQECASIRKHCCIVPSAFTPVFAKHSKSFSLIDCLSVGADRMQRNFEPMRRQVES
jgi:hypothetical protein